MKKMPYQTLFLEYNQLSSLPGKIYRLINLQELYLDESSYKINNLDLNYPILILGSIKNPITN
jgi:hypothetical protein